MDALTKVESLVSIVPWAFVSFFLKRTLNQIEKRLKESEIEEKELRGLLSTLNARLDVLNWTVNNMEAGTKTATQVVEGAMAKQDKKIERLTTQVNTIVNRLTMIRSKLEAAGQKIQKDAWQGGEA